MTNHRMTRRSFVELGAVALVVGPESIRGLFEPAIVASEPTVLKSRAQYISEAAEFDAGIRDLTAAASLSVATAAERLRLTTIVAGGGPKLDHFHSWMVAQCLADPALVRWVNSELRDEASVKAFIERVKRNPSSINTVPAIAALRSRLTALAASKRAIVQQIANKERLIATMDEVAPTQAELARDAAECQKTWTLVTAILVVVVAVILATVAVVVAAVTTGATQLSLIYAGTGADLAHAALKTSYQRYQDCVRAASTLTGDRRTRAIAACQARWLSEKSVYMV
jgi:hypothetical protein